MILFTMLGNRVCNIFLLEKHIPGVGDIGKDHLDVGIRPFFSLAGEDAFFVERPSNLNP